MVTKTEKADMVSWVIRIGSFIMSIAIMVSSWFLNQAWNRITTVEAAIHELQLNTATSNGNRFTSKDWVEAKAILDTERLSMDRRVIRLEEAIPVIKDTLLEMKQTLNKPH